MISESKKVTGTVLYQGLSKHEVKDLGFDVPHDNADKNCYPIIENGNFIIMKTDTNRYAILKKIQPDNNLH